VNRYDFSGVDEWTRIRGWFSIEKAIGLQRYVRRLPIAAQLVELGSFEGRSTVAIAAVMPPQSVLHCIDHFQGSPEHQAAGLDISGIFESFLQNVERFGVRRCIRVLRSHTVPAAREFADHSIDLLFHDASHDFESVVADLRAWMPKLKPGGWLVCDDYEEAWQGVIDAVRHLGLAGQVETNGLWVHQIPAP
jgi:predicted O-methyltransferase YrrM